MVDDRERWDERYRGERGERREAPDPFVVAALDRLGPGRGRRALDLAAGTGRHAVELARRGWRTAAWDVSPVGLAIAEARAREAGVAVETRAIDLARDPWPAGERPDLVVVADFLDRSLLRALPERLAPGGHLLARTFTLDWPGEKPPPEFRLEPGEWTRAWPGLDVVLHAESDGRAGLLARRADQKEPSRSSAS